MLHRQSNSEASAYDTYQLYLLLWRIGYPPVEQLTSGRLVRGYGIALDLRMTLLATMLANIAC
jgi:hypothetical protein